MNGSDVLERLLAGDARALGRAISLVENRDPRARPIAQAAFAHTGAAAVTGFTGPPGAGKSTLIGAVARQLRRDESTVGILSIDPSSPFTTGAVLGDRVRLSEHFADPGVFIRSMASRGALGGLSQAAMQAVALMDASGRDEILVETVGVGQSEIDVTSLADTVVLVLMPGAGDAVQAIKAGIMEIPDIVVVNKCDQPAAEATMAAIRAASRRQDEQGWAVPVIGTESIRGDGVDELVAAIVAHRSHLWAVGELEARRSRGLHSAVLDLALERLRRSAERMAALDPAAQALLAAVVAREVDQATAADDLVALLTATR